MMATIRLLLFGKKKNQYTVCNGGLRYFQQFRFWKFSDYLQGNLGLLCDMIITLHASCLLYLLSYFQIRSHTVN